jgi:predicted P-loop ATPase
MTNRIEDERSLHQRLPIAPDYFSLAPQETGSPLAPIQELEGEVKSASTTVKLTLHLQSGAFGTIWWDDFVGAEVIDTPNGRVLLDAREMTRLMLRCELIGLANIPSSTFRRIVHFVAQENPFDSAQEWLSQLPKWDGTRRVERFLPDYLGTASTPYEGAVSRYVWTGLVGRLEDPGCKADMMPVLVGPQGAKKSTALKLIAPEDAYCADVCLTDRPRDLAQTIFGRSVLVWEELQGVKGKCDFDRVKTFLTREYLEIRSQDKRIGTDRYPSRYLVFGTSNTKGFLRDPTGHRRFLPFDVHWIDLAKVARDKLQLWAEALHIVRDRMASGEPIVDFEDAERLARREHENYLRQARWIDDPELDQWLERQTGPFSTAQALDAIGLGSRATQADRIEMAASLRQLGYFERRTRVTGLEHNRKRWHKPRPARPGSNAIAPAVR